MLWRLSLVALSAANGIFPVRIHLTVSGHLHGAGAGIFTNIEVVLAGTRLLAGQFDVSSSRYYAAC